MVNVLWFMSDPTQNTVVALLNNIPKFCLTTVPQTLARITVIMCSCSLLGNFSFFTLSLLDDISVTIHDLQVSIKYLTSIYTLPQQGHKLKITNN